MRGEAAKTAFADYVRIHLVTFRQRPDETILSQMANSDTLTETEIIDSTRVIIFGGLETTAALLANTLWALLTHPAQLSAVRSDERLLKQAVEEAFRWESPVQTCTRHVTHDMTMGDVSLKAGDTLQCMLGAANRDLDYFDRPDEFNIHRLNAAHHLGFGTGKHFCIGAALARLEASVGLHALLARLPNLGLYPDYDDQPSGHEFRSPAQLQVMF
jgi:cytochrome P450